ncbi:MAG: YjbQ family protein [Promethearchaeota archaeon]
MSEERLYQPDFNCIFGEEYANAFHYGRIDSLIWPIYEDVKMSNKLKKLLSMKNPEGRHYFYRRKLTLEDLKVELECSGITRGLIQGMELGRNYGIDNEDVISVVKSAKNLFLGVLSYDLNAPNTLEQLKREEKEIKVVGVIIYPSYTNLDLEEKNENIEKFFSYCRKKQYFIKIDIGNMNLPQNHAEKASYLKLKTLFSNYPENIFIMSGLDVSGDFSLYYQLIKYFNNVWLELDPRTLGGMTPTEYFNNLFNIKGFIQNSWHRIIIGSATPTLESSQMVRGFLEASMKLNFSQRLLLRTWAFRNVNRINKSVFIPLETSNPALYKPLIDLNLIKKVENSFEIIFFYKLKLRSYSITQLIYLTDIIKNQVKKVLEKNPELQNGEFLMRTYHTTTTFIINEHEYGNYLDLHYMFAEISKRDSGKYLHTVRALENRADFNHYDHELASVYGTKHFTIPIVDGKLELGGRENFYILVTFGPRTFNLLIKIRLMKK